MRQTTYVNDTLNLAQDGRDRLANERDNVKETDFADQDVEKNLVDFDKLLGGWLAPVADVYLGEKAGGIYVSEGIRNEGSIS